MTAHVLTFPSPPLSVVEQSPAGTLGYPEPVERVDISGCPTGVRVWLDDKPFHDFATFSNAARAAEHLRALLALGVFAEGRS